MSPLEALKAIETMRKALEEMDDVAVAEQLEQAAAQVEGAATAEDGADALIASMLWREAATRLRKRAVDSIVADIQRRGDGV